MSSTLYFSGGRISLRAALRATLRAALFVLLATAARPGLLAADAVYHVLQRGETLYSVARSFGVLPDAIAKANSIEDPSKIRAGMRLLIPGAQESDSQGADTASEDPSQEMQKHKVLKGETLFSIARSYGISLIALRGANKLSPSSMIKAGDVLLIPSGSKAQGDPAPPSPSSASPPKAVESSGARTTDDPAPGADKPAPDKPATPPAVPEAVKTTVKAVDKDLKWPCPGEILYLEGKAYGILIRSKLGESVKALASGTVSSAGPYRGYGNVVFVLSKSGYIYVYGGNDSLSVRAGEEVKAGQELGKVGMDAKEGGPAAYFLVFKNGSAVDPAAAPRE
jgi:murein DD-endopeptidase MepM/ murein hydrolase activator NlpD